MLGLGDITKRKKDDDKWRETVGSMNMYVHTLPVLLMLLNSRVFSFLFSAVSVSLDNSVPFLDKEEQDNLEPSKLE